jgi:hypothetical protein
VTALESSLEGLRLRLQERECSVAELQQDKVELEGKVRRDSSSNECLMLLLMVGRIGLALAGRATMYRVSLSFLHVHSHHFLPLSPASIPRWQSWAGLWPLSVGSGNG